MARTEHPYILKLKAIFAEGRIDRREFLRTSTLLGLSPYNHHRVCAFNKQRIDQEVSLSAREPDIDFACKA